MDGTDGIAGTEFYIGSALWAAAMLVIFIQAIRLSYRIEARSPDLANRTGVPRKAMILHTISNWKVARDEETQELRRKMNLLLLANLVGFALFGVALAVMRAG